MAEPEQPQSNPFDEPRIIADPEEFFTTYKNHIFAVIGGVVLVTAAVLVWWFMQQSREAEAMDAYQTAMTPMDYQSVSAKYKGTHAAGFALLDFAVISKEAGDWEGAETAFREFISTQKNSPLAPAAELGLARALQAQEKWEAAESTYLGIITQSPRHPFAPSASIGLAEVYRATDQVEAAKQTLSDLLAGTSDSPLISEAERMLKDLQ